VPRRRVSTPPATTGQPSAQVQRLRAAGAADYVTKPINAEWLLDTVTGSIPALAAE
jgi:CheY-like chemotaxis protein